MALVQTAHTLVNDSLPSSVIQSKTVSLTNAEIKALRATPKTLVAAPGAGYMIQFISILLFLDYGSNVLTESADNLEVRYGAAGQAISTIECTGFIDNNADIMISSFPAAAAAYAKTLVDNKALVLQNNGDGEFGGNAGNDTVIDVVITYRIVPTGW